MYRKRLQQKAMLLVVLLGFLILLIMPESRREPEEEAPVEGEELVIPEEDEEYTVTPEEVWEMPGADARIRVLILAEDGSIWHREKELPRDYPGELIYYEEEEGWVIVNEVPLEEYLRRVVPSEMPSAYAKEALKAQAVCARTYAVWQMREYAYPEYEAHVNDSVSYQVYNHIDSQETTDQAVEATAGQIMLYGDGPVKAYYFAASCGSTTDENIWEKGDREQTPYIAGRRTGTSENIYDLTEEEAFSEFIQKKHPGFFKKRLLVSGKQRFQRKIRSFLRILIESVKPRPLHKSQNQSRRQDKRHAKRERNGSLLQFSISHSTAFAFFVTELIKSSTKDCNCFLKITTAPINTTSIRITSTTPPASSSSKNCLHSLIQIPPFLMFIHKKIKTQV